MAYHDLATVLLTRQAIEDISVTKRNMNFLIGCANIGYARSCKQILAMVESYLNDVKGTEKEVSS